MHGGNAQNSHYLMAFNLDDVAIYRRVFGCALRQLLPYRTLP